MGQGSHHCYLHRRRRTCPVLIESKEEVREATGEYLGFKHSLPVLNRRYDSVNNPLGPIPSTISVDMPRAQVNYLLNCIREHAKAFNLLHSDVKQ